MLSCLDAACMFRGDTARYCQLRNWRMRSWQRPPSMIRQKIMCTFPAAPPNFQQKPSASRNQIIPPDSGSCYHTMQGMSGLRDQHSDAEANHQGSAIESEDGKQARQLQEQLSRQESESWPGSASKLRANHGGSFLVPREMRHAPTKRF